MKRVNKVGFYHLKKGRAGSSSGHLFGSSLVFLLLFVSCQSFTK